MTDNFITDLPDGALPAAEPLETNVSSSSEVCNEVSLQIMFLYNNRTTNRIVARFDLDSPFFLDEHEKASGSWSLALPYYEMMNLIFTLQQSRFMKVVVKHEELLT